MRLVHVLATTAQRAGASTAAACACVAWAVPCAHADVPECCPRVSSTTFCQRFVVSERDPPPSLDTLIPSNHTCFSRTSGGATRWSRRRFVECARRWPCGHLLQRQSGDKRSTLQGRLATCCTCHGATRLESSGLSVRAVRSRVGETGLLSGRGWLQPWERGRVTPGRALVHTRTLNADTMWARGMEAR